MKRIFLPLFATVSMFVACSNGATGPDEPTPVRQLTAGEQQVVASTSAFGWRLFNAFTLAEPDENVILSPLSVTMALGMALNGAELETWSQMREALSLDPADQVAINAGYRGLIDVLSTMDPRVTMTIANSVWTRENFPVLPGFIDTLRLFFDAHAQSLDFSSPDASSTINAWVKNNTGGRIPEIVPSPIPEDVIMYLINAVYFKGIWQHRFDPALTSDAEFTDIHGMKKTVAMMSRRARMRFMNDVNLSAADIPYGWDRFRMMLIVPRDLQTLRFLESNLSDEYIRDNFISRMQTTDMELQIPRFTIESEYSLNEALKSLGMPRAFDPYKAEFTRINPDGGLYITNVKHKTFIRVDEEGSEAAAATSVEVGVVSMPPTLRADRPFLFVLYEANTGAMLFVGRVATIGD